MADFYTLDSSVTAYGTAAAVPIVARVPNAENAAVSLVSVYLNGLNIDGDPDLTVATEERAVGASPVTVVTGVQAGASLVTSASMRLVIEFSNLQVLA